jgi:orotidine-5'-phosphate decarboxylase
VVDPAAAGPHSFSESLKAQARHAGSVVCVGLDPRPAAHPLTHPDAHENAPAEVARAVAAYANAVLDATHDVVACCKPQAAFFEALGLPGLESLAGVLEHARGLGLPVILDAKRGDIGSTAEAYARAYQTDGAVSADALTVNPYLGLDTLEPFIDAAATYGRGLFVLVRTSNPGSATLQELELMAGGTLYQHLADRLAERAAELNRGGHGYGLLGAVGGATAPDQLADLRSRLPHSLLLVPGYGAQGGIADDVMGAFDESGWGAVVNSIRFIMYSPAGAAAGTLS